MGHRPSLGSGGEGWGGVVGILSGAEVDELKDGCWGVVVNITRWCRILFVGLGVPVLHTRETWFPVSTVELKLCRMVGRKCVVVGSW